MILVEDGYINIGYAPLYSAIVLLPVKTVGCTPVSGGTVSPLIIFQ